MSDDPDETGSAKFNLSHATLNSSIVGDYAKMVNYNFPPQQAADDPGVAELRCLFEEVGRRLDALEEADRQMVAPAVQQAAQAAAEIQAGDTSEAKQSFLETRLKHIAAMAPDIGEVIITTLASPIAGVALVLQKVARKVQADLGAEKQTSTS